MTELEQYAAEAWAQVVRPRSIFDTIAGTGPMPPAIALDYCQNVTGDRDDAATAILDAAARWLEDRMPTTHGDEISVLDDAMGLLGDLRSEHFSHVDAARLTIYHRADERRMGRLFYPGTVTPAEFDAANDWCRWAADVELALRLCREVVLEAYPVEDRP